MFVCDGGGAIGGVHGGSVVLGGVAGVTGSRPGAWIGYSWRGTCCGGGVGATGGAAGCCSVWGCPGCDGGLAGVWADATATPATRANTTSAPARERRLKAGDVRPPWRALTTLLEEPLRNKDDVVRL